MTNTVPLSRPTCGARVDLLAYLVGRPGKGVVFALWGKWAKAFEGPIREKARHVGASERVRFVRADHPVNRSFLTGANSLADINARLIAAGDSPVDWMPA